MKRCSTNPRPSAGSSRRSNLPKDCHVPSLARDALSHRCSCWLRQRRRLAHQRRQASGDHPTTALTQLIAPVAQILALAFVTALYLAFGRRTGTFGLISYLLNAFALEALVCVEFVINIVFR